MDRNIPRYSSDLISLLEETVEEPEFPRGMLAAMSYDATRVRGYIWQAAQRALVEQLRAALQEDEENAGGSSGTADGGTPLPNILDTDGEGHRRVASVHLAGGMSEDDDSPQGSWFDPDWRD